MEVQTTNLTKIVFGEEKVITSRPELLSNRRPLTGVPGSSKRTATQSLKIKKITLQVHSSRPHTPKVSSTIPISINTSTETLKNGKIMYPPIIQQSESNFKKQLIIADLKTHRNNAFTRQNSINSTQTIEKFFSTTISKDRFRKVGVSPGISPGVFKPQTPMPGSRSTLKVKEDLDNMPRFRITSARKNLSQHEFENQDGKKCLLQNFASARKPNDVTGGAGPQYGLAESKKASIILDQGKDDAKQLEDSDSETGKDTTVSSENQTLNNNNDDNDAKTSGTLTRQQTGVSDQAVVVPKRPKPNVSAESWILFNVKNGEIVSEKNSGEVREIASLTKIMTAIVTLDFIEKSNIKPQDYTVRVSSLAPLMCGTTAKLREGDTLTLWDALHALMLPSGNDAAVAIAESIGKKLMDEAFASQKNDEGTPKCKPSKNPIWYFVSQMNAKAKELGMNNTRFANPHGLNEKDNISTALDMAILSAFAMKKMSFRMIVKRKTYECAIVQSNRVLRPITWENTNKLLNHGYDGLKTGITPSAGPCLASSLRRGDNRHLICVVLNCGNTEMRFSDSRRLMEYGMRLLLHQDKGEYVSLN